MIAGAPGAFGSLVIFNSSCEIGCHSSPALTECAWRTAAPENSNKTSTTMRRWLTIVPPFGIGRNAEFDGVLARTRGLHFGELTALWSRVVLTISRSTAL